MSSTTNQQSHSEHSTDRGERKSSFLGSWKMLFLLAFIALVFVFAINYAITARLKGDYVAGTSLREGIPFRMNPLPVAGGGVGGMGTLFRGAIGGDLVLYGQLGAYMNGSFMSASAGTKTLGIPTAVLERVDGPGAIYRTKNTSGPVLYLERFPEGLLTNATQAHVNTDWPAFVKATDAIVAEAPGSLTAKWWHLTALLLDGRRGDADALFASWEAEFEADPLGRGQVLAAMFRYDYEYSDPKYDLDHKRAAEMFPVRAIGSFSHSASTIGLDTYIQYVREAATRGAARAPQLAVPYAPFLDMQVTAKTMRVEAMFAAVRGDHDAAHELLFGNLAIANPKRPAVTLIEGLIDVALPSITFFALNSYYIEGAHDAARLEERWPDVAAAAAAFGKPHDLMGWIEPLGMMDTLHLLGSNEADTRSRVAAVQAQQFAAGYRARHHRTATGDWPTITGDYLDDDAFALRSEDATTRDYFNPTEDAALRWAIDGADFVVWSYGPDKDDDVAAILYDPTNGTDSNGDIVMRVLPEPRYDWPSEPGYLYEDYADFDRRYPGGELPADPYGNRGLTPLRLARDHSHRVWSFGPNADQGSDKPPFAGRVFQPHYDPTNGTTSEGDLWMELPLRPDAQLPPAVTPAPTPTPVPITASTEEWFDNGSDWGSSSGEFAAEESAWE